MKKALILPVYVLAAITLVSCGKKQQQEDIIIERVIDKPQSGPQAVNKAKDGGNFTWAGQQYSYAITYEKLDSAATIENNGEQYYDNVATLTIRRSDGSELCKKQISKKTFSGYLSNYMKEHGVFLSTVYEKTDNSNAYFVASIGSPDESYEEFVVFYFIIDRNGGVSTAPHNRGIE